MWMALTDKSDTAKTTEELMRWFESFGIARNRVTDQGTHFLNEVMNVVKDLQNTEQHFKFPYTDWSDGILEVFNRELKRMKRAI